MSNLILKTQQLFKSYHDGLSEVQVLKGIDVAITKGDRVAIIGPSGSGKSTLLHLLGGLDKPSSGQVYLNDTDWQKVNEKERCRIRNRNLGFVYQFHHLLPEFTALENVAIPLLIGGGKVHQARARAEEILEQVGLKNRLQHKPAQLSGGERQRVAIARALVHQPHCLLADEPTGNLDQHTAAKVLELMLELNRSRQTSLVLVTHDSKIAQRMDKIFVLNEGLLAHSDL